MMSNAPSVSENAIRLIKEFEGCRLKAYRDTRGIWTIGFGDTGDVFEGQIISQSEAEHRLRFRLANEFEPEVWNCCCTEVPTAQEQFDAMVSLCYNIGVGGFHRSDVCGWHSDRFYSEAEKAFGEYIHSGGQVLEPLVRRRAKEAHLYRIGTDSLRANPSAILRV